MGRAQALPQALGELRIRSGAVPGRLLSGGKKPVGGTAPGGRGTTDRLGGSGARVVPMPVPRPAPRVRAGRLPRRAAPAGTAAARLAARVATGVRASTPPDTN